MAAHVLEDGAQAHPVSVGLRVAPAALQEGGLSAADPPADRRLQRGSIAFAIPVAVFDTSGIGVHLEVRRATGDETYLSFSGELETPDAGEVIFADSAGRAHARRWTNRQSRSSAVGDTTTAVLIVAEAMHASGRADVESLTAAIADELNAIWSSTARGATLSAASPRFEF